jgi:hypothetical protein
VLFGISGSRCRSCPPKRTGKQSRPPIHTITLQANVEDCLRKADTYEDVDVLLSHLSEAKKADHLLFNREVVIEQKDYNETQEHRKKARP